ncbi:hypothetical protein KIN20_034186 [Parelaphostrongylus tenuis]|uniref:Uncharacterized protein n=1 Tax=Parelaphostrongylus tenuis TaxID=148309 RepID=A0AAD5R998_PARTN|nr:hypothetical protein KIN20_034186 [Parelaphostrongylus tenuis]
MNTAPVMVEWTTDVQSTTMLSFDKSSTGVQGRIVLEYRNPVDFYDLFIRRVWQLIVQQTNIYGRQVDRQRGNTNIAEMKRFLSLYVCRWPL